MPAEGANYSLSKAYQEIQFAQKFNNLMFNGLASVSALCAAYGITQMPENSAYHATAIACGVGSLATRKVIDLGFEVVKDEILRRELDKSDS